MYCNAGILHIHGINWFQGPINLFTGSLEKFFTDVSGSLIQIQGARSEHDERLGLVFATNVYGHYLMVGFQSHFR
jgi:hypothetical protein